MEVEEEEEERQIRKDFQRFAFNHFITNYNLILQMDSIGKKNINAIDKSRSNTTRSSFARKKYCLLVPSFGNQYLFESSDESKNEVNSNSLNGVNSSDRNLNSTTTTANTTVSSSQSSDSSSNIVSTASKSVIHPISLSGYLKGAIATPLVAIARNNQNFLNSSINRKTTYDDKKVNGMDTNSVINSDNRLNNIDDNSIHKSTKGLFQLFYLLICL